MRANEVRRRPLHGIDIQVLFPCTDIVSRKDIRHAAVAQAIAIVLALGVEPRMKPLRRLFARRHRNILRQIVV